MWYGVYALYAQTFLDFDSRMLDVPNYWVAVVRVPLGPSTVKVNVSTPFNLLKCLAHRFTRLIGLSTVRRVISCSGNKDLYVSRVPSTYYNT